MDSLKVLSLLYFNRFSLWHTYSHGAIIPNMTIHIHNAEANKLAHEIASRTGKSVEQVILDALRTQTEITTLVSSPETHSDSEILEIIKHCSSLPSYDTRSAEEILGYDKHGLPT